PPAQLVRGRRPPLPPAPGGRGRGGTGARAGSMRRRGDAPLPGDAQLPSLDGCRTPMARGPARSPRSAGRMNIALAIGAGVTGAAVGWGAGFLDVHLESVEGLQKEEGEERAEYEAEVAQKAEAARVAGEEAPAAMPWASERYGWTWLEIYLAPVLGAFGFSLL